MSDTNEKQNRVLFVCAHNSARSQMAETFLRKLGGERFHAESAGLEPRPVNPLVIEVMKEIGDDISENTSDSVFEFFKQGKLYDYVVTVCSESEDECPIFPGIRKRLFWPFKDPEQARGSRSEQLEEIRNIRDEISARIESWIKEEF